MMDSSPLDLPQLISDGESEHVEFKTRLEDNSTARVLSAFANTSGGVLLVGIGDGGEILGLSTDEVKEVHRRLQAIASSMFRPEDFRLGATEIDGKWVAYIKVNPLPDYLRPVATSGGEVYVRHGARIQIAHQGWPRLGSRIPVQGLANLFVAMSFRSAEEPALEDYLRAIERAARRTGLPISVRRMDFVEGDYEISQKIMDEIDAAEIVLADFTLNSPNVYFEVGYARGKGRRVIQTARKDTPLEFDVKTWRTLFYKNATELEERLLPAIIEHTIQSREELSAFVASARSRLAGGATSFGPLPINGDDSPCYEEIGYAGEIRRSRTCETGGHTADWRFPQWDFRTASGFQIRGLRVSVKLKTEEPNFQLAHIISWDHARYAAT